MPLRNIVKEISLKKYQLSTVFSLVNILTIPFHAKHVAHSLDTHGVPANGSGIKVSTSALDEWKVLGDIWFVVFHLNRLVPVNHFQMYFVLFTVNSYTLTSCCHGPVARQTCPTSRCEVTIRQRLTCFLFQWSHCTVNICNGNTQGRCSAAWQVQSYRRAGRKTPRRRQIRVFILWTAMYIGQESAKGAKLSSQHTVNHIALGQYATDLPLLWLKAFDSGRKCAWMPLWNERHRKVCIVLRMLDSNPTLTQRCQSFCLKSSIPSHWLSTQWTGEASLRLGEKTVWWCNPLSVSLGVSHSSFQTVLFNPSIQFPPEVEIAPFCHVHSFGPIFKTNFSHFRCWPVQPCLQAAGVQCPCLPAGLEHLSSHSSVPEFGAQFAYVATSRWEHLPLNT